jgi:tetratricopeptide (TPR) repeat protein
MIRAGDFDLAQRSLSGMLSQELTDRQRFEVLTQLMSLQTRLGKIHSALETTAEMDALATRFLPPISRVLQLGLQRTTFLAMIGEGEQAMADIEQMRNELQPPLDGLVMFAELNLYRTLDEKQAYRDTHAQLSAFFEKNPFPGVILDLLRNYTVIITRWDGEYEKSLTVFDELLVSYRRSFVSLQTPEVLEETRLEKAITLRLAGRLEEAAEIFNDLLSLSPANPRALLELAQVRIDQEQLPQARESLLALQTIYANADPDYRYFKQLTNLMAQVDPE